MSHISVVVRSLYFWEHFVNQLLAWRRADSFAAVTERGDWCLLCVVASVRCPRVVGQALRLLEGAEPRKMSPEDWHAYIVRLLMCADGHTWADMWTKVAPGCSSDGSGLSCVAKRLGIIVKASEEE